jgi:phage shock protein PspC (stress-responsive transcriptional regulator)
MNKTVSINLGGFFFHIDEDAYQKLNRYLDAIRRSLSPDAKDEIMGDIEGRIAELLSEKIKNDKQVVSNREVEDVITIMGQPEDYRIDEDTEPKTKSDTYSQPYYTRSKKMYRDGDKAIIAGVCAGLGHYLRIDPLWIRILFIISPFITFGTSVFVYILLWVLIERAITTTEKLDMTGEPINISNIEKKVKEEFIQFQEKFPNVDIDKIGANVKYGAEKLGNGVSTVVLGILKAIAKVMGAAITVFSALCLGAAVVFFIMLLFSSTLVTQSWYPYIEGWNFTDTPMWVLTLIMFFAIAIPLFALFISGLRILIGNMKPLGSVVTYTLLALWIISISGCIYLGMYQAAQLGTEGQSISRKEFTIPENETLQIIFKSNEYFTKYNKYDRDVEIKQDSAGHVVLYSNDVRLYIRHTDQARPYVQVEKIARANSLSKASKFAETIGYNFKVSGNSLILDNYLVSDVASKFRGQHVEVFLYLPEGMIFQPDINVQKYDNSDNDFFDLWFDNADHVYQMGKDKVECFDCIDENAEGKDKEIEVEVQAIGNPGSINSKAMEEARGMEESQDKTIRIMELEKERAQLEMLRMKEEHDFQREMSKKKN